MWEWRKPENPPEKSGYYLAITDGYGSMAVLQYSSKYKAWNEFDDLKDSPEYHIEILSWMPIPALPDWIKQ